MKCFAAITALLATAALKSDHVAESESLAGTVISGNIFQFSAVIANGGSWRKMETPLREHIQYGWVDVITRVLGVSGLCGPDYY
ncbi:hypothetical protein BJX62DRAFT_235472 [Aspergillus germanicus]